MWTIGELVLTAVGSDEGPSTGANSTSGRAISGSGMGVSPRLQLPQNDRHVIESAIPYQYVGTAKLLPVGLYQFPVDPRWRPGPTWKSER